MASYKIQSGSLKPEWLRRLQAGNDFNKVQSKNYPYNEVIYRERMVRGTIELATTPEMVGHLCLYAPGVVLRQATEDVQLSGCPYSAGTLFLLELEKARQTSGDESMVFLGDTWSRCPAQEWVPALLEGVWRRATQASDHGV